MTTVSINLSEIELKDLEGLVYKIEDLPRVLGNQIFTGASSIELSDAARVLHKGEAFELDEYQLSEIVSILSYKPHYKPWAHSQINQYLEDKIESINNSKKEENG